MTGNEGVIGQARRVAVIADVHGNTPALRAVLREIDERGADLLVSLGDVTWGVEPEETRELLQGLELPAIFVSGNGDRAVIELHEGRPVQEVDDGRPPGREIWMREHHSDETYRFLKTFRESVVVNIEGLGDVRFCHGSPRSDIEIVTPATPEERILEMTRGISERIILTGHVHLQFDRMVAGIRSINPGSVGMPYHELRGAFWAMLGPEVELKRTEYDLQETVTLYRNSDDPLAEQMINVLLSPPSPAAVTEYGEQIKFRE